MKGGRVPTFSGNTMTIVQPLRALARRIVVDFKDDFGNCTLSVIAGKEEGAKQGKLTTLGLGVPIEIQSITPADAVCAVKSGNVFE